MGIDIGKNSFHVVGLDRRGAIMLRQKWSRGQIKTRLANMPPCLNWRGSLRWRTSPEPEAVSAWSQCASAIASASRKSFFCPLEYARTYSPASVA
jgi:hypothetical protein